MNKLCDWNQGTSPPDDLAGTGTQEMAGYLRRLFPYLVILRSSIDNTFSPYVWACKISCKWTWGGKDIYVDMAVVDKVDKVDVVAPVDMGVSADVGELVPGIAGGRTG
ncbi:hypothetical protein [Syntrophomonas wolfei]|uniref:hypothetical protein n=2 Tax=Syntrophomonas wolfei TaxID=863 RepID=UPI0013966D1C|nr:hypothetical protein [Syntrophomonas wolfei]